MNIIFVCTGNTCRSPMAEAYALSIMPKHNFSSRGIMAYDGMPMSANAEAALTTLNIPHGEHFSKSITKEDIEKADLILTMSSSHKRALEGFGEGKIFTLKEYALGERGDIADPFGGDEQTYINCLEEIIGCIDSLKERLK